MSTRLVLSALMVSMAFTGSLAASPSRAQLSTRLELDQAFLAETGEVALRVSLTNEGSRSLLVPRYQIALDGVEGDLFVVERDGEPVAYRGPLYKRPAPSAADMVELKAGATLSVWVEDLAASYDFSAAGTYDIRLNLPVVQARQAGRDRFLLGIESNQVGFYTDRPLEAAFQPQLAAVGQFTRCKPDQKTQLLTALDNAGMLTGLAVEHLAANPSGSDLYTWWFGSYTQPRFKTVSDHYDALADTYANETVTFDCACKGMAYAYVYPDQPYNIHLCGAFWRAPALGRDSQAGTLVHETTHFTVVAGTDDYVYGASGAHDLAMSNPNNAVDNADNHEYFAEDQVSN